MNHAYFYYFRKMQANEMNDRDRNERSRLGQLLVAWRALTHFQEILIIVL